MKPANKDFNKVKNLRKNKVHYVFFFKSLVKRNRRQSVLIQYKPTKMFHLIINHFSF